MKLRFAPFLLLFSCAALLCNAQTAQIMGLVTDINGGVMPKVKVVVTNEKTGIVRNTETKAEGYYSVPLLPPGSYRMVVQAEGFRPNSRESILLAVDQVARIDFVMEVGTVTETIEVVGAANLVDSATATVGKVIENRRISDLPLNGRNALALVLLVPGVRSQASPTNSGFGDRGLALTAISINGGPGGANSYMLDGGNNIEAYQAGLSVNPSVEAVEEFKVQANTMSAEFGFTAGGVINMITKSGTNRFHGSAFEFVRNDKFDARKTFAVTKAPFRYNQFGASLGGPLILPRLYAGRNRTFFFYNYEDWRFRRYDNPIFSIPTPEQRNGDFSELRDASGRLIPIYDPATTRPNPSGSGFIRDLFPRNFIPGNRLDPVSKNILPFYPLPNRPPSNTFTNSNNFIASNAESRWMRQYTARLDHQISSKNALFGRYLYYQHFTDGGLGGVYPNPIVRQRLDHFENRNFILSDTHVFGPTLLNEFRSGVTRLLFPFAVASFGGDWPHKLGLPSSVPPDTIPYVSNGLPTFVTGTAGLRASTVWQFTDTVTYIRSSHNLKIGVEARIDRTNNFQRSSPSGTFTFPASLSGNPQQQAGTGSGFATFLLGAVGSASVTTHLGQAQHGYSRSFFVQDDWKLTRRLNVNLGLRYDFQPWPVERYNRVSNFDPFTVDARSGLLGRQKYAGIDYGRSAMRNDTRNFGPRLGFAYDVFGNGRTTFRGGYGIFYPLIFARDYFGSSAGFASTSTSYLATGGNSNLPAFQFQNGFPTPPVQPQGPALGPSGFLGQSVSYTQADERVPRCQQWNLSLQRQIGARWLLEVTYSGSHGTHFLSGNYDWNQLDPSYLSLGTALQNAVPNPNAGLVPGSLGSATITREQSLRPYPYYNSITVANPHGGNYHYHAFLLSVEKRFSRGLTIMGSYTAGKLISDSIRTEGAGGDIYEQVDVTDYQNGKFDRRSGRSLDPTDVAQRFVFSGIYQLPFGKSRRWESANRFLNASIGGWQVNSVTTIQTGLPVVIRGADNLRADRPNSTGASAKLSDHNAYRWFDTNAFVNPLNYTFGNVGRVLPDVRTPGVVNIDLSVVKDTSIREGFRVEFRAEAFNFANHVNLGFPDVTFVPAPSGQNRSATFGTITTSRDARIVQLGLKLIF